MMPQAHRCAALSLFLAAAATLLLYHSDAVPTAAADPPAPPAPAPAVAGHLPELTPGTPWTGTGTEPQPRPVRAALVPATRMLPVPGPAPAPAGRPNPLLPRRAFATVEPGETLADVARRVYGTPDAAARLWQANRDALPRPGAPVEPGTLLRTP